MNREQAKNLIIETFENPFNKERFINFIANLLKTYDRSKALEPRSGIQGVTERYLDFISSWERIGRYEDKNGKIIDILVVKLKRETSLYRARTAQRNFVAEYLQGKRGTTTEKDAALVAFVSPDDEDWRFSLVKMEYRFEETPSGKVKVKEEFTPAKRWSFLVGKNEKSHTAQSRFLPILENEEWKPTLEDLEKAFDVEVVTKEFFEKYRDLFIKTKLELDKVVKNNPKVKEEFERKNINTVDFAKKLLGQIVFLYFLQKKGWFGVERGKPWGTGPRDFIRRLFNKEFGDYNNFYNDILEPLFYEALRTDRSADDHYYSRFNCKISFLNGGLFDPPNNFDWVNVDILLPNELFSNNNRTKEGDIGDGILDVFDRYNFTVSEEEPLEKEVALDPELLGKIYEKLNAIRPDNFDEYVRVLRTGKKGEETKFNKEYGVYYTPREIVHYMCQESLINYLETELSGKVEREDIEKLVRYADLFLEYERRVARGERETATYSHKISQSIIKHANEIDQLLADIKICDPAVGSGAFPIGMLHEIVKLRQFLSVYLNREINTYDLKRHCIENSLYGVDIDPGAVETCKLRFWLSLVVDEEDFYNIKPLPNLDYKVVCGDSLLSVEKNLFNQSAFRRLEELKVKYFNETNPVRKQHLKNEIDRLIYEITKGHKEFDFEVYFSEVFYQKGGFDIVIANPPYVRQERIKHIKPRLSKIYGDFYEATADLYTYFYKKSYDILREGGILCFITSNKWMRAKYGEKLRKLLKQNTKVIEIVDFSGYSVFEQTVDTNIIILQKTKPDKNHSLYFVNVKSDVNDVIKYIRENKSKMLQEKLSDNAWTLADEKVLALKEKIEKTGKPLKDWDVKIYFGIKTGFNEAFIIDTETRNRILANCKTEEERKRTEEIIKPVLRGRDIEKWRYKWAGWWIILAKFGFYKEAYLYPSIVEHLSKYEKQLKARGQCRYSRGRKVDQNIDYPGQHHWLELDNNPTSDFLKEFEKEKIVWQRVTQQFSFCLVPKGIYILDSMAFMIGDNLRFLMGVLNSKLVDFYIRTYIHQYADTGFLLSNQYVERIHVPPITPQNQPIVKQIEQLVDKILSLTQSPDYETNQQKQAQVKALERHIDELVYELYGLTDEEIKIIEGE